MGTQQNTETFSLRDILALTTGRPLSADESEQPSHDIVDYMTSAAPIEPNFRKMSRRVGAGLLKVFPELNNANSHIDELDAILEQEEHVDRHSAIDAWLEKCTHDWGMDTDYKISPIMAGDTTLLVHGREFNTAKNVHLFTKKSVTGRTMSYDLSGGLPDDLSIEGGLDISDTNIPKLPNGLKIGQSLDISGTPIESLPEGMDIGDTVRLKDTTISELPNNLSIGYLNCFDYECPFKKLPNNLHVGAISIEGTEIDSLPDDIQVESIDLIRSKIKRLPDGLSLKSLHISETDIDSLPANLHVSGNLSIRRSNIESLPDDIQIGGLSLSDSSIRFLPSGLNLDTLSVVGENEIEELPTNLTVNESLTLLNNDKIKALPYGLSVETLNLENVQISALPPDLIVKGKIYGTSPDGMRYEDMYKIIQENRARPNINQEQTDLGSLGM